MLGSVDPFDGSGTFEDIRNLEALFRMVHVLNGCDSPNLFGFLMNHGDGMPLHQAAMQSVGQRNWPRRHPWEFILMVLP